MELSRNALGNLINRYRAVLRKCRLLNTFGALAVAAMLVMGATAGEVFAEKIGYTAGSPAPDSPEIKVEETTDKATAIGIEAWYKQGEHDIPDSIKSVDVSAVGIKNAFSYGVQAQTDQDNLMTVRLDSLEISSQATTEDREGRSFGIYSYNNSTVSMKGGSVTSSAQSNNGDSTAYGIFSGEGSCVTSGAGSVTASSSSGGSDT